MTTETNNNGNPGLLQVSIEENPSGKNPSGKVDQDNMKIVRSASAYSMAPGVGGVAARIKRFMEANPEVGLYSGSLDPDDKYPVEWSLTKVFEWLSLRVDVPLEGIVARLLDQQEEANRTGSVRKKMVLEDLLVEFSRTVIVGTVGYKLRFYNVTHGLFHKNHVDIPMSDEAKKIKGDRPSVEGSLTPDEIRRIVGACRAPERAMFALMYQGVMDRERFRIMNETGWSEIKTQLDNSSTKWVRVNFDGRKRNPNPYYTMFHKDGDAIAFLRDYLKERGEPRALGRDQRGKMRYEPIFLNKEGNGYSKSGLSLQWTQAAARAGVVHRTSISCESCQLPMVRQRLGHGGSFQGHHGRWWVCKRCGLREKASTYRTDMEKARYGKNLHEMRDTLITILPTIAGVNSALVEFVSGHQIDPLNYKKIKNLDRIDGNWTEEEWAKARPFLDVWTNPGMSKRQELEEENRKLKDRIDRLENRFEYALMDFLKGKAPTEHASTAPRADPYVAVKQRYSVEEATR